MAKWIKAAVKDKDKKGKGSFRNAAKKKKKQDFVQAANEPQGY